jgi:hypothetical protein
MFPATDDLFKKKQNRPDMNKQKDALKLPVDTGRVSSGQRQ